MRLKSLLGSGDRILMLTLPFLAVGTFLNILYQSEPANPL